MRDGLGARAAADGIGSIAPILQTIGIAVHVLVIRPIAEGQGLRYGQWRAHTLVKRKCSTHIEERRKEVKQMEEAVLRDTYAVGFAGIAVWLAALARNEGSVAVQGDCDDCGASIRQSTGLEASDFGSPPFLPTSELSGAKSRPVRFVPFGMKPDRSVVFSAAKSAPANTTSMMTAPWE